MQWQEYHGARLTELARHRFDPSNLLIDSGEAAHFTEHAYTPVASENLQLRIACDMAQLDHLVGELVVSRRRVGTPARQQIAADHVSQHAGRLRRPRG